MNDYVFDGGTAVVTGAASGIGRAVAEGLARRGSGLVLLDRDGEGLASVVATLRSQTPTVSVETVVVDLADRDATRSVAGDLATDHPETTLLVNNAGVALAGRFEEVGAGDFDWLLEVNFGATVTLTRALLPVLRGHPGSHLANVSSVYGLIGPAGQSAYAASKFAVRGFTEVLRHELAGVVGVTCVHPGGVRTAIARNARIGAGVDPSRHEELAAFERLLTIAPQDAAEQILAGVARRRPRVLIGSSARLPDLLARVAPGRYGPLLDRVTRLLARP